MASIKIITADNWNQPDPASTVFRVLDPNFEHERTAEGLDYIKNIQTPKLAKYVPEDIVTLFEVARGTMCYGFLFLPTLHPRE